MFFKTFFPKFTRLKLANLFKNETLAQVFSCEFCGIFKNIFLPENLRVTVSGSWWWFFSPYYSDLLNWFVIFQLVKRICQPLVIFWFYNPFWFVIFWLVKLISTKTCSLTRSRCFRRYDFVQKFYAKNFCDKMSHVHFPDYII